MALQEHCFDIECAFLTYAPGYEIQLFVGLVRPTAGFAVLILMSVSGRLVITACVQSALNLTAWTY